MKQIIEREGNLVCDGCHLSKNILRGRENNYLSPRGVFLTEGLMRGRIPEKTPRPLNYLVGKELGKPQGILSLKNWQQFD